LALVLGTLSICLTSQGSVFVTFILSRKAAPVMSICHGMVQREMLARAKPGIIRGRSKVLRKHDTRKASFCMQEGDGRLNGKPSVRKALRSQTMCPRDHQTDQEWLSAVLSWKHVRQADRDTSSASNEIVRMSWCLSCQQPVLLPWDSEYNDTIAAPSRTLPSAWKVGRKKSSLEIC
jgi:hypothetical protein